MEDRQEILAGFLKYGKVIPPEDFDKYRYENGCDPPEAKPTLEEYQKEVSEEANKTLACLPKFVRFLFCNNLLMVLISLVI